MTGKINDLSTIKRRVAKIFAIGMLGNLLGIASNFILPPYFISNLGEQRYGAWLYLFSIPLSLAMLDLGISAAFSAEIYMLHSQGDSPAAAKMFKQGIKFLTGLILVILLILGIVSWIAGARGGWSPEIVLSATILSVYVLTGFYSELLTAPYKIHGRYHIIQLAGLTSKVLEIFVLIYLIPSDNFVRMAFALLLLRITYSIGIATYARKVAFDLFCGSWRNTVEIRHLYVPGLMYAINPLIAFISLQLPLIIIGSSLNLPAVVAYTTIRTLARLPVQVSSQISFSLQVEYTRMHFDGFPIRLVKIYRKSIIIISLIFLAWVIMGSIFGQPFYEFWLKRVEIDFQILFFMIIAEAFFESVMRNKIALSASINKHKSDVLIYLSIVTVATLAMYISSLVADSLSVILIPSMAIYMLCASILISKKSKQYLT